MIDYLGGHKQKERQGSRWVEEQAQEKCKEGKEKHLFSVGRYKVFLCL